MGGEAADKFLAFEKLFKRVKPDSIVKRGLEMDFTKGRKREPSFVYASVFSVASWIAHQDEIEEKWLPNIVKFGMSPGLNPELQFLFFRELKEKAPEVMSRLRGLPAYRLLAQDMVKLCLELYR